MLKPTRKPTGTAERIALEAWRSAMPRTAMLALKEVRYTPVQRRWFLLNVVGLVPGSDELGPSESDITTWASDEFVRPLAD
ncbi:hypothetical protein [Plantactinospora sp. WMMB782]|uniref:hypothetical protein n=1 Tax=Plantactinospora sp. WMMB782 TaxID=3404121 RepID=UPI003B95C5FB